MNNKYLFIVCLFAAGLKHTHGEEYLQSETELFSSLPSVSSVSRISQTIIKAPASTTIIDRELIIASGAQNWVDLFRLVPGMQAYSINANRPGIDYHGIGAEFPKQLEVTVDGRSVYQPLFSTVEWSVLNVNIDDIDYIEVVRGSNAASQGSNAFKAAINIVTQRPHLEKSTHFSVTAGSRDTQKARLNHNGYLGNIDYQFNFGFERNDGFPSVTNNPDPEDNGPLRDGRDLLTADFRMIYAPSLQNTLEYNMGASHNHTGWGDGDSPDEYSVVEWDSRFTNISWQHLSEQGDELRLQFSHTYFQAENDVNLLLSDLLSSLLTDFLETPTIIQPGEVPFVLDSFGAPALNDQPYQLGFGDLESDRYDLELEHRLQPLDRLKLSWGTGYRHEQLDAEQLFDNDREFSLNSRRLFGSLEWSLSNQLTANLSGLLERNNLVETLNSSRASLNFHPSNKHAFRLSYAHGERSPSLLEANERNLSRFGNAVWELIRVSEEDLGPEKLNTLELAYLFNLQEGLSFDLKVFREQYRDLIYDQDNFSDALEQQLPDQYSLLSPSGKINRNILDLDMDGAEMQLRYYPGNNSLLAFHYTYLDLDGEIPEPTRVNPRQFGDKVSPHTVSILASTQLAERVSGSLWLYHMNEVDWDDGNTVDEFIRIDAQLRYELPGSNNFKGALSLVGQNLGGAYSEFSENNVFDTRIYLKLELQFL